MTVGELLKELRRFNQELNVYFASNNGKIEYSICEIDKYATGVYVDLKEEK